MLFASWAGDTFGSTILVFALGILAMIKLFKKFDKDGSIADKARDGAKQGIGKLIGKYLGGK